MGFDAVSGPNWIVPTAPAGDSSNRVADTAFVTAAVAGGPTGGVLQIQYAEMTTFFTFTTTMAGGADTIPVATDGSQIVTVTLTPNATSNQLLITGLAPVAITSGSQNIWMGLFQDAANTAIAAIGFGTAATGVFLTPNIVYQTTAGTTGPTTIKMRIGNFNGANTTFTINGQIIAGRRLGGSQRAVLTVVETKV